MRKPFTLLTPDYFAAFADIGAVHIAKAANVAIMEDKAFAQKEQLRMQADAEKQLAQLEACLANWQATGNRMNEQIDELRKLLTEATSLLYNLIDWNDSFTTQSGLLWMSIVNGAQAFINKMEKKK